MDDQQVRRLKACGIEFDHGDPTGRVSTWVDSESFPCADQSGNPPDLTDDANAARYVLPVVRKHLNSIQPPLDATEQWAVRSYWHEASRIRGYGDTFGQALVTFLDALIEAGLVKT